jgi:alkane 1-monooxygenase
MYRVRALKYASPLIIYLLAVPAFTGYGILCWLPLIYAWILIPVVEILVRPDLSNMNAAEEELAKKNRLYDYMLYAAVVFLYFMLYLFLSNIDDSKLKWHDLVGRIYSMGLLCGTFGINVGHELGHRVNPKEQWLAKAALLVSLYTHFFIEHNKGHHKHVATPEDPSSARLYEPVYLFYFRTVFGSFKSAWRIAKEETIKKNKPVWSLHNEMIQLMLLQVIFVSLIVFIAGVLTACFFLISAVIGALLLETINYIEHYGLSRQKKENGSYERTMPRHSWNSNHVLGRLMLFELSRHSDHHYLASRKYQILRHHDDAPQMPTGYPGMMILSLVPPLWFYIMHKKMEKYNLLPVTR